jgi:4-oxalocrotonate tautomerase
MPFVHIRLASRTPLRPEQVRRLQTGATRLMADVMRKRPDLTAVLVEEVPPHAWSVGGEPVPVAAHLDVKVTAGTNTAAEKERFVAEATALLREVAGEALPVATYVVVHEVAGDAWGYDGLTQEERRIRRERASRAGEAA